MPEYNITNESIPNLRVSPLLSSYNALAKRLPHGPLMGVKRHGWHRASTLVFFILESAIVYIGKGWTRYAHLMGRDGGINLR